MRARKQRPRRRSRRETVSRRGVQMSEPVSVTPRYIVDANGNQTDVVLTLEQFRELTNHQESSIDEKKESHPLASDLARLGDPTRAEIFTYSIPRKMVNASASLQGLRMVVLKGSIAALGSTNSMGDRYRRLRDKLIRDEVMKDDGHGYYVFTRDYPFSSPSAAACVVEGGSRNGFVSWQDSKGRTLRDLGHSRRD